MIAPNQPNNNARVVCLDQRHRNPQTNYQLALDQFDWGHPSEFETAWLTKRGVSFKALMGDWPVGAANVNFDGKGHFNLADDGERALTFVAFDAGNPIDIIAWRPRSGQIASYTGVATFLGDQDDSINPATWFNGGDLIIHATPLEWLKHDREGLMIVNFKTGRCLSAERQKHLLCRH